jgi:hypothetical protein
VAVLTECIENFYQVLSDHLSIAAFDVMSFNKVHQLAILE